MLVLTRKVESDLTQECPYVWITDGNLEVKVYVLKDPHSQGRIRLAIKAPKDFKIERSERIDNEKNSGNRL